MDNGYGEMLWEAAGGRCGVSAERSASRGKAAVEATATA
jgi:hypothetical protein